MPSLTQVTYFSFFVASSVLSWLYFDSLQLRFQIKDFLRGLGALFLGLSSLFLMFTNSVSTDLDVLYFLLHSGAFYLLYLGFIFDPHAKFQFGLIVLILGQFLLNNHFMLALQAGMVAVVILQLSYTTKHRDLIPLGISFVLMSVGEILKSTIEEIAGSSVLYLFASFFILMWIWQYLAPRFRIKRKRKNYIFKDDQVVEAPAPPPHQATHLS